MSAIWEITESDVEHLRGRGGVPLATFMDQLLRGFIKLGGLPDSVYQTTIETTIPDGGVDAAIQQSIPGDTTGYFGLPTVWQFRATEKQPDQAKCINELKKGFVLEYLENGFAYRFATTSALTPKKIENLQKRLQTAQNTVAPGSPHSPMVVSGKKLAELASRFPALIQEYSSSNHNGAMHSTEFANRKAVDWRHTPTYVPIERWQSVSEAIIAHADFGVPPASPVLVISGDAGVGKSRLVHEVLRTARLDSFVIFLDEQSDLLDRLWFSLDRQPNIHAIVVVDDCLRDTIPGIFRNWHGLRDRVRLIAITHAENLAYGGTPQYFSDQRIQDLTSDETSKVLTTNFAPGISPQRIWEIAQLSKGSLRIAGGMCVDERAGCNPLKSLGEYFERCFQSREEKDFLGALALFSRIGSREQLVAEKTGFLGFFSHTERDWTRLKDQIRNRTGFIAEAGKFVYVTPRPIADHAWSYGFDCWVRPQGIGFFDKLPDDLKKRFWERLEDLPGCSVGPELENFFFQELSRIRIEDLRSTVAMNTVLGLIGVKPTRFLPLLEQIFVRADDADILAITERATLDGRWGPRRYLLWQLERFMAFPEWFHSCERILFRLALNETDTNLANNATNVWKSLFWPALAGNCLALAERLEILRTHLLSSERSEFELSLAALSGILDSQLWQVVSSSAKPVHGRLPPDPKTPTEKEWRDYLSRAISTLKEHCLREEEWFSTCAKTAAVDKTWYLLQQGCFGALREMLDVVPEPLLPSLIQNVEEFLRSHQGEMRDDYLAKVGEWIESKRPMTLKGRLTLLLQQRGWDIAGEEELREFELKIAGIRDEFLGAPELVSEYWDVICDPQSNQAGTLATAIGEGDQNARIFHAFRGFPIRQNAAEFVGYYVASLLHHFPSWLNEINGWIDDLTEMDPATAFLIYEVGGDNTRSLQRTLRLFDEQKLDCTTFQRFKFGVRFRPLTKEEFSAVWCRLRESLNGGNARAGGIGLTLAMHFLNDRKETGRRALALGDPEFREWLWEVLGSTADDPVGKDCEWMTIVKALSATECKRGIQLVFRTLNGKSYMLKAEAVRFLGDAMATGGDPAAVQILDNFKEFGFHPRVYLRELKPLFEKIPPETIKDWLEKTGVDGARKIARHLPTPFIDQDGNPRVPKITETVLSLFEDDDRTFHEFCAGVNSGKIYKGDIAAQHETEAKVADHFLSYANRRIAEWAKLESASSRAEARHWREHDEELRAFGV